MTLAGSPFCSEGAGAVSRHEWGEGSGWVATGAGINPNHAVDGQRSCISWYSR